MLAYYTLISKSVSTVAGAMQDVGKLARKIDKTPVLQRYLKEVVMDSPDAAKARQLEKILDNVGSEDLEALISRVADDRIDDLIADFSDDLTLVRRFVEEPGLVDGWRVIEGNPILRKKPENLESISKWLGEGIEPQKLTDGIAKSPSKQKLIDELGLAQSKLHAQVLIKDYDNIPGVMRGRYTPNGSTLSDKVDLPSGWADDFDLPVGEVENFTGKIEPLELKPGDRIFRVSGDDGVSGPYWTRTKPEKLEDVIGGTAVKPAWNNFEYISEYVVPDGVTIKSWVGKTASQRAGSVPSNYYLPGGDEQLFISFIENQDSNFSNTVKTIKSVW